MTNNKLHLSVCYSNRIRHVLADGAHMTKSEKERESQRRIFVRLECVCVTVVTYVCISIHCIQIGGRILSAISRAWMCLCNVYYICIVWQCGDDSVLETSTGSAELGLRRVRVHDKCSITRIIRWGWSCLNAQMVKNKHLRENGSLQTHKSYWMRKILI